MSEEVTASTSLEGMYAEVPGLAAKHQICDIRALYTAMAEAKLFYGATVNSMKANWQFHGKPDTLDKLLPAIDSVLALLQEPINRHRLGLVLHWRDPTNEVIEELRTQRHAEGSWVWATRFGTQPMTEFHVDDFILLLMKCRRWADVAHHGRGKPTSRHPLILAYEKLVAFWLEHGPAKFTNHWHTIDGKPEPISHAARFLYAALTMICSERQRLAQELRDLMSNTVSRLRKQAREGTYAN
jgi:hypothetical protein